MRYVCYLQNGGGWGALYPNHHLSISSFNFHIQKEWEKKSFHGDILEANAPFSVKIIKKSPYKSYLVKSWLLLELQNPGCAQLVCVCEVENIDLLPKLKVFKLALVLKIQYHHCKYSSISSALKAHFIRNLLRLSFDELHVLKLKCHV